MVSNERDDEAKNNKSDNNISTSQSGYADSMVIAPIGPAISDEASTAITPISYTTTYQICRNCKALIDPLHIICPKCKNRT